MRGIDRLNGDTQEMTQRGQLLTPERDSPTQSLGDPLTEPAMTNHLLENQLYV